MKAQPLTLSITLSAQEHGRVAAFCRRHRFAVEDYVAVCGVNADHLRSFSEDEQARDWLAHQIEMHRHEISQLPPPAAHVVTVALSPVGAATLNLLMVEDGHATEADCFLGMLASNAEALGNNLTSEGQGALARLFAAGEEEADSAAYRDDLALAAAAKPPQGKR